jgi:glycosyltransferase involved in cell wall biosynthesis
MRRVTVGMPVRNGAPLLAAALESVVRQDFDDLDILVSDNASTDETPSIIAEFQRRDARIRSVRHAAAMPALNHFHWVKDQARGEYFMWAAHDDVRSTDFVSGLARGLDEHARAVLAFGDLHVSREPCRIGERRDYEFETEGRGLVRRVRKAAFGQCFHLYGLWRTDVLRRIPEAYALWWPDLPIMTAAACLGEFIHVVGPRFGYYETFKSNAVRAEYQDLGERFHRLGSMLELQRAVWRSCAAVAGPAAGAFAMACVAARHASEVPGFLLRRTRDRVVGT